MQSSKINVLFRSLFIATFLLIISTSILGQNQQIRGVPLSGSGSIFGGPIVNYSTIQYHKEAIHLDSVERNEIKGLEKFIHGKRRHRLNRADRTLKIKFHNYTSMRSGDFRNEVSIQEEALERDFAVDSSMFYELVGEEHPGLDDLQMLHFVTIGNNYNPEEIGWEDWNTFQEDNGGPRDQVSIFVVEDIPDRLGHGYAQYGWINRPEAADIIIRSASFGSGAKDFTEGKVLTHLMANYLGLLPLTGSEQCGDDYVSDSPIHNSPINFCLDGPQPTSLCDNQYFLPQNFMAHTPDVCKDSFTVGQWKRMLHMLNYISENK